MSIEQEEREKVISKVLRTLSPREEKIIKMLFGFEEKEQTQTEIASFFCLSRTRIYQIKNRAFRRLRRPERIKILKTLTF